MLALIPARGGSLGIPGKNVRKLAGLSPIERAVHCARAISSMPDPVQIVVSTDMQSVTLGAWDFHGGSQYVLTRPHVLAQDDTPMIDVVKHALSEIQGPEDQIVLLLQPTQPLRQPKHLTAAIDLLQTSGADSVVSVVALPLTHNPNWQFLVIDERLVPFPTASRVIDWSPTEATVSRDIAWMATRRQDLGQTYIRDGTVYAFRRSTVTHHGHLYGRDCRPLVIPPSETTPLDTPDDWLRAEELLRAK